MRGAVVDSAEDLVGKSQANTPVDTGTLRAGQHVDSISETATSVTARVATGGESDEYAIFVHEGTYKMAGRPFMANALIDNRAVYVEAIKRAARGAY
jgi:HK97 gp10 family phage protein